VTSEHEEVPRLAAVLFRIIHWPKPSTGQPESRLALRWGEPTRMPFSIHIDATTPELVRTCRLILRGVAGPMELEMFAVESELHRGFGDWAAK